MRRALYSFALLAILSLSGCGGSGNGIPRPEDTPGWNAVEAYASSIRRETMTVVSVAQSNPREANNQASSALENFQDGVDAGPYAETIAEIKEKLKAMASGQGKATGLKELAAKLPGDAPAAGKK